MIPYGGLITPECQRIPIPKNGLSFRTSFTCGTYLDLKKRGASESCAWKVPFHNKKDTENDLNHILTMHNFTYGIKDFTSVTPAKPRDPGLPSSARNPVGTSKVDISAIPADRRHHVKDAIDLWLALGLDSYTKYFEGRIKQILWDPLCTAGGYAQYFSYKFTWCPPGAMRDSNVNTRFESPGLMLYRSILMMHEALHSNGLKHDHVEPSYEPCGGTAKSAFLAYRVATACEFDYCEALLPIAANAAKHELNYDFINDKTKRKSKGLCKKWTSALGITGEGF